jgi:hypothetical protein
MEFLWEGEHLGVSDKLEKSEWSEGRFQARSVVGRFRYLPPSCRRFMMAIASMTLSMMVFSVAGGAPAGAPPACITINQTRDPAL